MTSTVDYTTDANCLLAPPLTTAPVTLVWSDGETSSATGSTLVTSAGRTTSGLFAGHLINDVVVYPNLDVTACLTTGVSSVGGPTTLTVL
ncbi:hypothetical protein ACFC6L_11540 [Kitasatospora phosalacinea]|uniref:hypothetical protein n=1 Tax=Kitasatospora phosalacinea TaxID=2065 RepID=UPI0035E1BE4E